MVSLHSIQGEYQSQNFEYMLSYERHPMHADDVLLHKPTITAEDFQLPAGVRDWETLLLDPKEVGRVRAGWLSFDQAGNDAAGDVSWGGLSRLMWLRNAGCVLGLITQ
jgi:hypothetical protein